MIRQRYTDYNTESVFVCPQGDNVQREGVISFKEEAQLIKRASINMANYDFSEENIETEYDQKETIDIIGEKKELDKMIKANKKEYEKEKEELHRKAKEFTEQYTTRVSQNKTEQ